MLLTAGLEVMNKNLLFLGIHQLVTKAELH